MKKKIIPKDTHLAAINYKMSILYSLIWDEDLCTRGLNLEGQTSVFGLIGGHLAALTF
jgi:hypothetical protein